MPIRIESRHLNGLLVLVPDVYEDERGFFLEVFRADQFAELGLPDHFPQANQSHSRRGVIRGLHFQWQPPQGKLMRVACGRALLVAVDIRPGSPTLGQWHGIEVDAAQPRLVWAPAGFARGFCVRSESADIHYLCTAVYNPRSEAGIVWNDPDIGIDWGCAAPLLSPKDRQAFTLAQWLKKPSSRQFRYPDRGISQKKRPGNRPPPATK